MSAMAYTSIRLAHDGPVSRLTLDRPDRRNAIDPTMMDELADALRSLAERTETRVVVLGGEGAALCAGADINYMRAVADYSREENVADARRLASLFLSFRDLPKPVVARVHGAALGGGAGLVAACDIAVAADDAIFGFTETRLGLLPAVISPFVVPRIGVTAARDLFLTGERFGAARAREIGLVAHTVPRDELDAATNRRVAELLQAGPEAQAAVKRLLPDLSGWHEEWLDHTAALIADRRASGEGREGLQAFLGRRKPAWAITADGETGS